MKKILLPVLPFLCSLLLLSCASTDSAVPAPKGGAIEYTKTHYISMLSLDSITAGMQKLKPSYTVSNDSGYTSFHYNFELHDSSKIKDAYATLCASKGGKYLSSDWTVGLCSRSGAVSDSLFFVNIKPVEGFGPSFKFVNLWVLEPNGSSPKAYEQFVKASGYQSSEQLSEKRGERMAMSEAQRVIAYMRTVGSNVCKKQGTANMSGTVEQVTIEKIQIRTVDQKLIWAFIDEWHPC